MKIQILQNLKIFSVVLGSTLLCSIGLAQNIAMPPGGFVAEPPNGVITNSYTNYFFTNSAYCTQNPGAALLADYSGQWGYGGGQAFSPGGGQHLTNDTGMTLPGNPPGSGSLRIDCVVTKAGAQQNFFQSIQGNWSSDQNTRLSLTGVTEIGCWVYMSNSPNISLAADGTCGRMLFTPSDTSGYTGNAELTIPATALGNWVKITDPNWATDQAALIAAGHANPSVFMWEYDNWGQFVQYMGNKTTFPFTNTLWFANPYTYVPIVAPPVPRPSMNISNAVPGLNLFTSLGLDTGGTRENLQTPTANNALAGQDYSWVGASGPVSYSFTIPSYPIPVGDTVTILTYFVPNPGTEQGPDYTESNVVTLSLSRTAAGVVWNFNYKTNAPNCYCAQTLASLSNTTAIGTWTVTFNQDTNVTMTGPGVSTNFSIGDTNLASEFNSTNNGGALNNGMSIYFGASCNNGSGANDHVVISEFKTSGTLNDIDDVFANDNGVVNGDIWFTNAGHPTCIQMVAPGNPYWAVWNQLTTGFQLESTTSLLDNSRWTAVTSHAPFSAGTNYWQLISTNDLPAGKTGFFAAVLPAYTQLQVLFPGETAAPGTATGKTGTPNSVGVGAPVYLTVNSVDKDFNPINTVTNTVLLTGSNPSDPTTTGQLTAGTAQIVFEFGAPGTWTVTATDTNQPGITPNTSTPVTAN